LAPAPSDYGYVSDSFISFPLFVGQRAIGVLNLTDKCVAENSDVIGYNSNDLDLLETIAPQLAIALDRASLQQKAGKFERLSITDSLTGLLNRRYLDERLKEEIRRSLRDGKPMSFLMVDIDNFKSYNDRFGHQAGDEVLKITAQALKFVLRGADVAARYGGEEFCLLLPNTTLEEAKQIGERIREHIEDTDFPNQGITVSIGVSTNSPLSITAQEIIESADKALYQAKRFGKNNVQLLLFEETQ
jgi:diguanylate cyclase (GGDEF)-like protein